MLFGIHAGGGTAAIGNKEAKSEEPLKAIRDRTIFAVENPLSRAQRKYPTEEEKPFDEHFRAFGILAEEVVFEGTCPTCGDTLDHLGRCGHEAHGD